MQSLKKVDHFEVDFEVSHAQTMPTLAHDSLLLPEDSNKN